jgi:hypothetical protein
MTFDSELRKKLQILLGVAIVLLGARTSYIVYERYEERKQAEQPKPQHALKADYYVTPKKLHPYDLKSARVLTRQPVWVKVGYYHAYYPYDVARRKTEFGHEAGTLLPLQKLSIQDVVTDAAPQAPGIKQVLARFAVDGKNYAVPIGSEQGGEFKIYSDDIFFIEDPHELYKHWPADVWKAIDNHEVQAGMSELQATCAIGAGSLDGASTSFSRTLHYANGGKALTITYRDDKAVAIKAGT